MSNKDKYYTFGIEEPVPWLTALLWPFHWVVGVIRDAVREHREPAALRASDPFWYVGEDGTRTMHFTDGSSLSYGSTLQPLPEAPWVIFTDEDPPVKSERAEHLGPYWHLPDDPFDVSSWLPNPGAVYDFQENWDKPAERSVFEMLWDLAPGSETALREAGLL